MKHGHRSNHHCVLSLYSLALLAASAGCVTSLEGDWDERVGVEASAITAEIPGVVEYAFRYYSDPDLARSSFAAPAWNGGCSATMIGPNVVLTAAHCGPKEAEPSQTAQLTFTTFRANENERNVEMFTCKRLIHGWRAHDLALLFCNPKGSTNPGDKYGYLDFETRAPRIGDDVYSFWWNAVESGVNVGVPLYSAGEVVSTTKTIWDGILGGPGGQPVGITMNVWAKQGASGSSNIDRNTHRILVGPTTTAGRTEGASRDAFSMRTYLSATLLPPGTYVVPEGPVYIEQIKADNFPAGSYDFASYVGSVDKNKNAIFDVQEDIERQFGENRRTFYWLGFDNRRRKRLWETTNASIGLKAQRAAVSVAGPSVLLKHRLLNLKPNTRYRIGMRVKTTSAAQAAALRVAFVPTEPVATPTVDLAKPPTTSYATLVTAPNTDVFRTALITTAENSPVLTVSATAAFSGTLGEIVLAEDGAIHDFELADQREGWQTALGRANFLPRGVTAEASLAVPDFALAVRSFFGTALPVFTDKLVFPNRVHRLCFKARALSGTATGLVQVTSGSEASLNGTFALTTGWSTYCYSKFATPNSPATLTFSSSGTLNTSYLIDDIQLSQDTTATNPPIGGGVGGGVLER